MKTKSVDYSQFLEEIPLTPFKVGNITYDPMEYRRTAVIHPSSRVHKAWMQLLNQRVRSNKK